MDRKINLKLGNRNKKIMKKITVIIIYIIILSPMVFFGSWLVFNQVRSPPEYSYDPILQFEDWTVAEAGNNRSEQHKSNTDMIFYNNSFYLIHAQTKWHLQDTKGALVILKSPDASAGSWQEVAKITMPNTDVRDPKFADIGGRLFLYYLPNYNFDPGPNTTFYTYSDDGFQTFPTPMELEVNVTYSFSNGTKQHVLTAGWNLWRPKTPDNITWYVLASGRKYGEIAGTEHDSDVANTITVLLKTTDGLNWNEVSEAYTRYGNGEACIDFLPNGEIISTFRVGSMGLPGYAFGTPHGATVIGITSENFTKWWFSSDFQTRFDGATLFTINNRTFAVGRNHLGPRDDMGNHFAKKRTAFYEVKNDRLVLLFDLPSNGDTAYTGVVVKDGSVYACYYTNLINKDYAWFVGLAFFPKTEIRMAKVSVTGLLAFADSINGGT